MYFYIQLFSLDGLKEQPTEQISSIKSTNFGKTVCFRDEHVYIKSLDERSQNIPQGSKLAKIQLNNG